MRRLSRSPRERARSFFRHLLSQRLGWLVDMNMDMKENAVVSVNSFNTEGWFVNIIFDKCSAYAPVKFYVLHRANYDPLNSFTYHTDVIPTVPLETNEEIKVYLIKLIARARGCDKQDKGG